MDPLKDNSLEVHLLKSTQNVSLVDALTRELKLLIEQGRLAENIKMPATRQLAKQLRVSRNTVIHAYENLTVSGHLETRSGNGTFVKSLKNSLNKFVDNAEAKQLILNNYQTQNIPVVLPHLKKRKWNFLVGVPETRFFPHQRWRQCINSASRTLAKNSNFGTNIQGAEVLREAITYHISASRAVPSSIQNVVVTSGAQQALFLLAKILIEPKVTKVAIEYPGYPMARHIFERAGAVIVDVSVDSEGIVVDDIPTETSIVYVTPSHQFPMGVALSAKRRYALLALANTHNMCVIEDDYDCEFRIGPVPIDALKAQDHTDRVVYLGTFSKTMIASLRVGFAVLPSWLVEPILAAKMETDWFSATLIQVSLAEFITRGELKKYIRKMRKLYEERFHALRMALKQYDLPLIMPHAGVHATALLPDNYDAKSISKNDNVAIASLSLFYPQRPVENALIFGIGSIESSEIKPAVDTLFNSHK